MASATITYMSGFANYAKLFSNLSAPSSFCKVNGYFRKRTVYRTVLYFKIRKKPCRILSVVLTCVILTYGGVSLFVAFVMLPVAIAVFRAADIQRLHSWCLSLWHLLTMTALPKPTGSEYSFPSTYFGTDSWAALVPVSLQLLLCLAVAWHGWVPTVLTKEKAGKAMEIIRMGIVSDNKEVPGIGLAFAPSQIILVVNLVLLSKMVYPNVDGSYLKKDLTVHWPQNKW